MNPELTPNTQATLLLTAPLIVGRRAEPAGLLAPREYNQLARVLQENEKEPADLLEPGDWFAAVAEPFGRDRLEALLGRGFLLSQAIERWRAATLWVISRADAVYPGRIRSLLKTQAPPVFYGCGDSALLEKGGLAVVGSRHVDDALREYTINIGALAADAGRPLISGAARGIDQSAMTGALQAGGESVGVMADSLERAALAPAHREPLHDGNLVLMSPYDPAAGFNVGHAMQRNKMIYALADAGLVVNSDHAKGGTWAGAIEQLEKFRFGPLFVRDTGGENKGCAALIRQGGIPWPEPSSATELEAAIESADAASVRYPEQETLPLFVHEK
ncbi:MAG: DNA-protecting protein DprA [Verrucomicrobia bacterium]|nr:DNA-protecting protein DprA [Verrucomicrobiota bacterium]